MAYAVGDQAWIRRQRAAGGPPMSGVVIS